MIYEIERWYKTTMYTIAKRDEEISVPKTEIPDEQAAAYMALLEKAGYKRHEARTHIWYEKQTDCRHGEEIIFYK